MSIDRHKVFVSYYHQDDQFYKNVLVQMQYFNEEKWKYELVFDDYSVGEGDIDDSKITDERIRVIIRDEYIKDATVLVLLCGKNSKYRKHIDWEIHAAMFDTEKNPKMGILVVNLPGVNNYIRASDEEEKNIIATGGNWVHLRSRQEFEKAYPYMPERIIDNFMAGQGITVVNWDTISNNPKKLLALIDKAFIRKNENVYDHSRPLKRRNS
ncbi:MAG: TIR domain-containing protein [Paludibacteraceae bacterium]|nr:TIR domain-containing protein [Paludibacteraceae bacterium]